MSPSPSPSPLVAPVAAAKAEPDLFFPASDSEDEHEHEDEGEILAAVPSSTVRDVPSSSTVRGELGSSSAAQAQPQTSSDSTLVATSDEPIPFFASQDSDILPVSPVSSKLKPRARLSPSHSSRSSPAPSALEVPSAGPSRKRSSPAAPARSPSVSIPEGFTGGYLGEFVCEGWSLSKGKGYCSPGSKIVFERPKPPKTVEDEARTLARSKEKVGPARLVNGKVVHAKGKPVAGKQMTLGAMGMSKKAPPPVSVLSSVSRETQQRSKVTSLTCAACQEGSGEGAGGSDHPIPQRAGVRGWSTFCDRGGIPRPPSGYRYQ